MANNNNNSGGFIFIFIAAMFIFAGEGTFILPLVLFYIFYKMFAGNRNNKQQQRNQNQRRGQQRDYRRRDTDFERPTSRRQERTTTTRRAERPTRPTSRKPKNNPYKKSGMAKYKEYDYNGAIEDFEKSLAVDNSDVATHFNIACAYSIMENKDLSLIHI